VPGLTSAHYWVIRSPCPAPPCRTTQPPAYNPAPGNFPGFNVLNGKNSWQKNFEARKFSGFIVLKNDVKIAVPFVIASRELGNFPGKNAEAKNFHSTKIFSRKIIQA
jgi:hypothetical protein